MLASTGPVVTVLPGARSPGPPMAQNVRAPRSNAEIRARRGSRKPFAGRLGGPGIAGDEPFCPTPISLLASMTATQDPQCARPRLVGAISQGHGRAE